MSDYGNMVKFAEKWQTSMAQVRVQIISDWNSQKTKAKFRWQNKGVITTKWFKFLDDMEHDYDDLKRQGKVRGGDMKDLFNNDVAPQLLDSCGIGEALTLNVLKTKYKDWLAGGTRYAGPNQKNITINDDYSLAVTQAGDVQQTLNPVDSPSGNIQAAKRIVPDRPQKVLTPEEIAKLEAKKRQQQRMEKLRLPADNKERLHKKSDANSARGPVRIQSLAPTLVADAMRSGDARDEFFSLCWSAQTVADKNAILDALLNSKEDDLYQAFEESGAVWPLVQWGLNKNIAAPLLKKIFKVLFLLDLSPQSLHWLGHSSLLHLRARSHMDDPDIHKLIDGIQSKRVPDRVEKLEAQYGSEMYALVSRATLADLMQDPAAKLRSTMPVRRVLQANRLPLKRQKITNVDDSDSSSSSSSSDSSDSSDSDDDKRKEKKPAFNKRPLAIDRKLPLMARKHSFVTLDTKPKQWDRSAPEGTKIIEYDYDEPPTGWAKWDPDKAPTQSSLPPASPAGEKRKRPTPKTVSWDSVLTEKPATQMPAGVGAGVSAIARFMGNKTASQSAMTKGTAKIVIPRYDSTGGGKQKASSSLNSPPPETNMDNMDEPPPAYTDTSTTRQPPQHASTEIVITKGHPVWSTLGFTSSGRRLGPSVADFLQQALHS
eukprot:TRINITY_DN64351_c0_g1_i1.p1 TRINITY_DN64351_c0_g1~~TRINITY_DN64351_c0_g1_i1.p1  ORF type:complete len:655 (-),score=68.63 TRINITY_DN64351_c0_g1_i1:32-1996(-)